MADAERERDAEGPFLRPVADAPAGPFAPLPLLGPGGVNVVPGAVPASATTPFLPFAVGLALVFAAAVAGAEAPLAFLAFVWNKSEWV